MPVVGAQFLYRGEKVRRQRIAIAMRIELNRAPSANEAEATRDRRGLLHRAPAIDTTLLSTGRTMLSTNRPNASSAACLSARYSKRL